jgi:hypothetical protein
MIYLYLKIHRKTKLKYLGKTVQNPYTYKGSGKYWKSHLKTHGNDVKTVIIKECSDKEELESLGRYYSEKWDVKNSPNFANLKEESGDGGDTSEHINYKVLNRNKGKTYEDIYGEDAERLRSVRRETVGKNSSKRKGKTLVELYGKERAEEITRANSEKHKGSRNPLTEETKRRISEKAKGRKYPKLECSVCGKMIPSNNHKRHMDTH